MHRYTEQQKQFLKQVISGRKDDEIADLFNEKFNTNIQPKHIRYFKRNNHIRSGINTQFKKGQVSFNKGKKWNEYMSKQGQINSLKTTFKKGNVPQNYKPVGSERTERDGYVYIKIADPNRWQLKHRYIYEQSNGKIPEGYNLIFADGNRKNITLDNLILVSKAEDLIMNNNKLFHNDKELTKTGSIIAKVISKTNELRKR